MAEETDQILRIIRNHYGDQQLELDPIFHPVFGPGEYPVPTDPEETPMTLESNEAIVTTYRGSYRDRPVHIDIIEKVQGAWVHRQSLDGALED